MSSRAPNAWQVGWEPGPTLALLAWEAQWLLYTAELERNLSRPAATLPVFTDQACGHPCCLSGSALTKGAADSMAPHIKGPGLT